MESERTLSLVEEIAEYANQEIDTDDEKRWTGDFKKAIEILETVQDVGMIQPVGDSVELYEQEGMEILKNAPQFTETIGIDSSSFPRAIERSGGFELNISNAGFGSYTGNTTVTGNRTVVGSYHLGSGPELYSKKLLREETDKKQGREINYTAYAVQTPFYSDNEIPLSTARDWVSTVARKLAIGLHLENNQEKFTAPLLIDGPIYPESILASRNYAREFTNPPAVWIDCIEEILGLFTNAINRQIENKEIVYGIVKGFSTEYVVKTIREKAKAKDIDIEIPWRSDYSFFSGLLNSPNYTYTSWFIKEYSLVGNNRKVDPLAGIVDTNTADYKRAFFYVQIPESSVVLRIEAPQLFVPKKNKQERKRIQQAILREIAETNDVPLAIKDADSQVNLSRQLRDLIDDNINTGVSIKDYNKDIRFSNFNYQSDNNE